MRVVRRWSKAVGLLCAAVGTAVLAGGPFAGSALASCASGGKNCYLIDYWPSAPQNSQIDAIMNLYCLYTANPDNTFVDEEIWDGTDNDPTGGSWIEVGTTEGAPFATLGRSFFWADKRPGYSYAEHPVSGTVTLDTGYSLSIGYQPALGNEWAVWINGTNVGNSQPNPPYSEFVEGGAEFTNTAVRAAATFWSLDWYSPGNTRTLSWSGEPFANGPGAISVGGPPQTEFDNYYSGTGTCTVPDVPASSTPLATPSSTAAQETVNPVPSASISAGVQSQLLEHVAQLGSWLGDAAPGSVTVVPATRYSANKTAFGSTVNNPAGQPDTTGVYVVQVTGNFTSPRGANPLGGSPPTGSVLTFMVDPVTNQLLDWGISSTPFTSTQLAGLGTATKLQENAG